MGVLLFFCLVLYFLSWKCKLDGRREPWMAKWQAAAAALPLRKPSHHFVRPYWSPGNSGKDWDGKFQEGIMFLSKSGWFGLDHARCNGWHFTNTLFLTLAFQINKKNPLITTQIRKRWRLSWHAVSWHWTMRQYHSRCLGVPSDALLISSQFLSINSCVMTPASERGGRRSHTGSPRSISQWGSSASRRCVANLLIWSRQEWKSILRCLDNSSSLCRYGIQMKIIDFTFHHCLTCSSRLCGMEEADFEFIAFVLVCRQFGLKDAKKKKKQARLLRRIIC